MKVTKIKSSLWYGKVLPGKQSEKNPINVKNRILLSCNKTLQTYLAPDESLSKVFQEVKCCQEVI